MGFNCGILGLPNVGNLHFLTLLLQLKKAESKNYPFCTIEPNKGKVEIKKIKDLMKYPKYQNLRIKFIIS